MSKQLELSFWNDAIDKKLSDAKNKRIERRNEWIRNNLPYNIESDLKEANFNGMK